MLGAFVPDACGMDTSKKKGKCTLHTLRGTCRISLPRPRQSA